ncbi:MAG: DUF1574 family protein [Spirulinaceae cyanobacterium]
MLDVDRNHPKTRNLSFSQWLYQALQKPEQEPLSIRLRVRLKGNNLLVLCEDHHCPQATKLVPRLGKILKSSQGQQKIFALDHKETIYQVVIYGKEIGQNSFAWIKTITLNPEKSSLPEGERHSLDSHKNLARSGYPTAIARYLSAVLSHLGVSVKVILQKLPDVEEAEKIPERRLWVICSCNYSPDPSLLAEPIAQKLRALELEGHKEAVVRAQVRGEERPDWTLRVDLTSSKQMLKNWAKWGDIQALTRLLNEELQDQGMEVRAVLKDVTLHLFASVVSSAQEVHKGAPNQDNAMEAISPILELLKPQGIESATVYGIQNPKIKKATQKNESGMVNFANVDHPVNAHGSEVPVWIKWLNLIQTGEGFSAYSLAQQGDKKSLTFLLQRLLNPELDELLRLGGIRVRLCRKQNLLHIMCEGITCPSQEIVPPIESLLRQLSIPQIVGVRIYGRRAGNSSATWSRGVDFVSRKSLAVEATPEFEETENYPHKVETATDDEAILTQQQEQTTPQSFTKIGTGTSQFLKQILCLSRFFVPGQQPTLAPTLTRKGIRAAIAWATLGLTCALATDRLLGLWLQYSFQAKEQEQNLLADFEDELLPSSPTSPAISGETEGVFNGEQFTQKGQSRIGSEGLSRPDASTAAILASARSDNPSFNNRLLDEKLALYQQQVKEKGSPPDVLVVGSSRALRGVDPQGLQETLAQQGYGDLEVFNFGVNGATAQVVDFILRRLLSPEELPKLIIWADGARAFNSGREDLTYQAIINSAGYQKLNAGNFANAPQEKNLTKANLTSNYEVANDWVNELLGNISGVYPQRDRLKALFRDQFASLVSSASSQEEIEELNPEQGATAIDINGFLPLSERFDPKTYYQKHPLVSGNYDGDYNSFRLDGEQDQAVQNLLQFLATQNSSLVFVNLPLTEQYLDPIRRKYEREFAQYMNRTETKTDLIFIDFMSILSGQNQLFTDPSHLNRYGAYQVSQELAEEDEIPFVKRQN